MTTIGLVRHGITEWNILGKSQGISDIPLNDLGREQAFALANRLSFNKNWDLIISSDLSRAKETAKIISTKLEISIVHTDERVREINCGKIKGTTEDERIKKWGTNWRNLDLGMEKFEDVSKRGMEFLEDTVNRYKNKRILVISHGALIGLTLQKILPEKFKKTNIENTSITLLNYTNDKWGCDLYNCTTHLVR